MTFQGLADAQLCSLSYAAACEWLHKQLQFSIATLPLPSVDIRLVGASAHLLHSRDTSERQRVSMPEFWQSDLCTNLCCTSQFAGTQPG